jgi:lipoprotein-anchoring transpeptidase ErfK/SrfK
VNIQRTNLTLGLIAAALIATAGAVMGPATIQASAALAPSASASAPIVTNIQMFDVAARGVPGGASTAVSEPGPAPLLLPARRYIDVSLTEQKLRLFDNGVEVFSSPAATGIPDAETPLGTYTVQYRIEKARFQGVYPDGRQYDVPEVPWILAFLGDYTIHAAPWRASFGRVGSNGCVSLPLDAAKFVYDWAEVGTPIHIHM